MLSKLKDIIYSTYNHIPKMLSKLKDIIYSTYNHIPNTLQFTSRMDDFYVIINVKDYFSIFYNQKIIFYNDRIIIEFIDRKEIILLNQIRVWGIKSNTFIIYYLDKVVFIYCKTIDIVHTFDKTLRFVIVNNLIQNNLFLEGENIFISYNVDESENLIHLM